MHKWGAMKNYLIEHHGEIALKFYYYGVKFTSIDFSTITDDADVEVYYYWYYGGMTEGDKKKTKTAIEQHDWETFEKLSRKYNKSSRLPMHAAVYFKPFNDDINEHRYFDLELNERTFQLITGNESEWG